MDVSLNHNATTTAAKNRNTIDDTGERRFGEGVKALTPPLPPPKPFNVTCFSLTPISPTQESALHKNQPFTRIRFTQETCSRVEKKKRVAPKAPPWHRRCHPRAEASSARPGDTHRCQSSTVWEGSLTFFLSDPPKPLNVVPLCAF